MSTLYHVGFYALVHHHGTYLTVRQAASTLPPGRYGLPGAVLKGEVGGNVAELHLRRKLLSQVGLSVGELTLCGSHTLRTTEGQILLNLIFGTEYNSGVPNPQGDVILELEWCRPADLRTRPDVPEWLLGAVKTHQDHLAAGKAAHTPGRGLLNWGR